MPGGVDWGLLKVSVLCRLCCEVPWCDSLSWVPSWADAVCRTPIMSGRPGRAGREGCRLQPCCPSAGMLMVVPWRILPQCWQPWPPPGAGGEAGGRGRDGLRAPGGTRAATAELSSD